MAAVADMRPELRACIEKADTVVPDLQYTLRVQFYGAPTVGTVVQQVTFKRIAGVNGTAPVEASTDAEACVADLVSRLELPPSNGLSEMLTIYRYDECTPKTGRPERDIESWNTHGITRE